MAPKLCPLRRECCKEEEEEEEEIWVKGNGKWEMIVSVAEELLRQ